MGALPTVTLPARISAFSRERDSSRRFPASTRSSRVESSSPVTVTSSLRPPFAAFCSKKSPSPKESCMTEIVAPEPTPEQAALFARVRRMMLIAGLTTAVAVAAVLIAIGYRLFRAEGSVTVAAADVTASLPKGARIVSTGVAGDRLVVTLEVGGLTEIRTFDARTLKPAGRLKFANEP